MFIILLLVAGALVFTIWLTNWVLSKAEGPQAMRDVAAAIREGAEGFLATQYSAILMYALTSCVLLFLLYLTRPPPSDGISTFGMAACTAATFITGALMSAAAGYVGMWISVRANVRTAAAALRSYEEAINVALRGGAVCGLLVVGSCVFGLTSLFMTLRFVFPNLPAWFIPNLLVGFGFGASLVALFAQLGGGIYTKAADVGADLVGKVEAGIPEDDPRNPAVIADLVGDNVGDCAGRGADLFESISAEIIGAMLLGGSLAKTLGLDDATASNFMLFPLLIHSFDLIVSSVGVLSVHVKKSGNVILSDGSAKKNEGSSFDVEGGEKSSLLDNYKDLGGNSASALEDPLDVLKRGCARRPPRPPPARPAPQVRALQP